MSRRPRTKARPRARRAPPKPAAAAPPIALLFIRDPKSGEHVAVGNVLRSYRYVIEKHPRGGWDVGVFAVNKPPLVAGGVNGPSEELLARAYCKRLEQAIRWCSRDFTAFRW